MAARDRAGSTASGGMGRECDRGEKVGVLADPRLEEVLGLVTGSPGLLKNFFGMSLPKEGVELRGEPVGALG